MRSGLATGAASVVAEPFGMMTRTDLTPSGTPRLQTAGKLGFAAARSAIATGLGAPSNSTPGQAPLTTARTSAPPPGASWIQVEGAT